ncbi:alkaline phosphatase family protein [Leifsonia sp. fls2-241-R2A-40a]|uniref:alkaline phosphatase family protein n=1 Tax=Leifsonia sp. fls2-241-R2A-40a TaxID=3040290 RepID=UPI00254E074E|nr:alkaline phosphatase family protein [Leifsonia sp. fls2-241-R2A-40a]
MLPAAFTTRASLATVMPSSLAALSGEQNDLGLPRLDHIVVIVVDGLGAASLRARAGHARTLAPLLGKATTIDAGFPTTTAAALATLTTGTTPGRHGLVGYRVRDGAGRLTNQLTGWDERMDPATWQRSRTIFERAAEEGVKTRAIGLPKFEGTGFTAAVLRGAEFVGVQSMAGRFEAAMDAVSAAGPGLTYLYVAELDQLSHARGWESPEWTSSLETLDALVSDFARRLGPGRGALLTADHGAVDVPESGHILYDTAPELLAGVAEVAGEPRLLHLYLEEGASETAVAEAWRDAEGDRSWIATRSEAIDAGWFGPTVDPEVAPRIGDVLVAPRKRVAYYDGRDPQRTGRNMVGQHGSLTPEETRVPLLRFGAAG